ncbi:MAG: beta-propeller fold lactonase family protein [bacterium]
MSATNIKMKKIAGLFVIICLLSSFSCIYRKSGLKEEFEGHLSVILELASGPGEEISINIGELRIKGDAQETPASFSMNEKVMLKGTPRKVLLGDFPLEPGRYTQLDILITEAFLFTDGRLVPVQIKDGSIPLETDIVMGPWEKKSFHAKMICGVEEEDKDKVPVLKTFVKPDSKQVELRGLKAYVTDEAGNSVLIFDRLTGSALEVVPVGDSPKGIVISPDGTNVYIANSGSDTISVLDTMTKEITNTIFLGLGVGPEGLAITPDGKLLISANSVSNNISLIDTDTYRIIKHISVGMSPLRVSVSPWGDWAFVANNRSDDLMIISLIARRVVSSIALRSGPVGVKSSSSGDEIFVCCHDSDIIQVIDNNLEEVVNSLPANRGPIDIVLDKRRGRIYVANAESNDVSISIESMNMREASIPVGESPNALALDDTRRLLYVVNQGDGTISIIDLGKERIVDTIKAGTRPWGIVLDRFGID